ncbi:unnamed protein product [Trichogramma brassicae]|uniref:Uncharacterized protein n=1 Tax=Trichogramma brassicae TaxID=86971 RepID=A0A6H5IZU9_9HYME|nr:unnamed protein product [Trichogramma brassicae]
MRAKTTATSTYTRLQIIHPEDVSYNTRRSVALQSKKNIHRDEAQNNMKAKIALLAIAIVFAQKTTESDEEEDQINPQKIDNLNHEVSEIATKKYDNETSLNGNDHCQLNYNCEVPKTGSMTSESVVTNGKKMSNCQILDVNIDCPDKSERVNGHDYTPLVNDQTVSINDNLGQLDSELVKIRKEINVKSLYEEAYRAYKPPRFSSIDNSKNDDGKIKIFDRFYEPFDNDLIIHVRSERGIEIWTKVRGSFSNENHIPSELKETKPVSKSDHKLNKLALKNLHRHLQGLITEDDPKDDQEDKLDFDEIETSCPTDRELPYQYGTFPNYDLFLKMRKAQLSKPTNRQNSFAAGIDYDRYAAFSLANLEADENEIASGGDLYLPSTTNDPSVPKELYEKSIELLKSEVETNSEEKSTINNYKVSS